MACTLPQKNSNEYIRQFLTTVLQNVALKTVFETTDKKETNKPSETVTVLYALTVCVRGDCAGPE